MIDLSLVIVSWNTRQMTLDCVGHARRLLDASPLRGEILLVDNGSADGTVRAVRRRHPAVDVIARPANGGFAVGANAGLAAMRGRHALLLNTDARPLDRALESCVAWLDAHPRVGLLGPALVRREGSAETSAHAAPRLAAELAPPWLHPRLFGPAPTRPGDDGPRPVEALRGAALFARAEAVRAVGGLSEDYFFFLEETDWCLRMRRAGWEVVHHPGARVLHASGYSSKRPHPAATRIEYHRSLHRYYRTHRGPAAAAALRAIRLGKSLLHVASGAPLAWGSARRRVRWQSQRAVLGWYLRGCPDDAGLAAVAGRP